MSKRYFLISSFVLFVTLSFSAQAAFAQKPISGGALNGRAISLPRPSYPPIAKAARASGTVVVQVTIDEEGNVISATAISGHPLLKAAAVQAANGAKFSPTTLQGQPVKVIGTINYNFFLPMSWLQIGDELGKAERMILISPSSVAANLSAQEFEFEIREIHALSNTQIKSTDSVKVESPKTDVQPVSEKTPVRKDVVKIIGTRVEPISKEEYSKRISSIINSLQSKLDISSVRGWYFSLGLLIGRGKESIDDEPNLREMLENLRQHSINAPFGVDERVVSNLQQLGSYTNKPEFDGADKERIRSLLLSVLLIPIEKE
jgi:TonB family protein